MRFALIVVIALFAGLAAAQAQFQLLPDVVAPSKPAVKTPKPEREASTHGNFPRRMKREEIEALFFTGLPVEATGLGRASFRVTFFKNGEAERLNHKDGQTEHGKWRFLGDGYCSKWGKSYEGCYTVVKDGDTYKIVRGTRAVAFWQGPAGAPKEEIPVAEKKPASPPVVAAPPPQKEVPQRQEQEDTSHKSDLLPPPNDEDEADSNSDEDDEETEK